MRSPEVLIVVAQFQVSYTGEGLNPSTLFRICRHDEPRATHEQGVGSTCRGVCNVREGVLPRLEVTCGAELDIGE